MTDLIRVLVRFEEPVDTALSDEAGGLLPLVPAIDPDTTATAPGIAGTARVFDASLPCQPFVAQDAVVGASLLNRDVTVQAIIAWDLANWPGAMNPQGLIARGKGDVVAEYSPFVINLEVVDAATSIGRVFMSWNDSTGAEVADVGADFVVPSSDIFAGSLRFFLLTSVRHWVSSTESVVRHYVNDRLIADNVVASGNIAGSTTGTTSIGSRFVGGTFDNNGFNGAIDEIMVTDYEMSPEEIQATWLRLSLYQPDGYRQIREAMQPGLIGDVISDDPQSGAQQDLRSIGVLAGLGDALVENMRANIMPDRAYGQVLRRWERVLRVPPGPSDSIDQRRARVMGQIGKRAGISIPGVDAAIAPVLVKADKTQLQHIAFSNTIQDTWATLDAQRWFTEAESPFVSWAATGTQLRFQMNAASNYTYSGARPASGYFLRCLTPNDGSAASVAFAKVIPTSLPTNLEIGICFFSWVDWRTFLLGVRNNGGAIEVVYQRYQRGAAVDGASVVLATTSAVPHWLRIRDQRLVSGSAPFSVGAIDDSKYSVSYSTVGSSEAQLVTTPDLEWAADFTEMGFYARTLGPTGGASDIRFDPSSLFRSGRGRRPFVAYVYRDPALPGLPDVVGANGVIGRMKHAYTRVAVTTSKSFLCDSSRSLCDRDPMGAI